MRIMKNGKRFIHPVGAVSNRAYRGQLWHYRAYRGKFSATTFCLTKLGKYRIIIPNYEDVSI